MKHQALRPQDLRGMVLSGGRFLGVNVRVPGWFPLALYPVWRNACWRVVHQSISAHAPGPTAEGVDGKVLPHVPAHLRRGEGMRRIFTGSDRLHHSMGSFCSRSSSKTNGCGGDQVFRRHKFQATFQARRASRSQMKPRFC